MRLSATIRMRDMVVAATVSIAAGGAASKGFRILIVAERRIASPEMLPDVEPLPHLKCSPAMVDGGERG